MRVDGLSPAPLRAMLAATAAAAVDDAFGADAAPATPPPSPARAEGAAFAAAPTSVAVLVALASTEAPADRRRRAAAGTDRGLSLLEKLRDELAGGLAAPQRLRELADWSAGFALPDEPGLAELARDVELRVRVELAKHELTA